MRRKGWLIYDQAGAKRNAGYIKMHFEVAEKMGVDLQLVMAEQIIYGVQDGRTVVRVPEDVKQDPDFVICRTIQPFLTKILELAGYRVFNNSKVAEIANHKAKAYAYLAGKGIPMIDTVFMQNEDFYRDYETIPEGHVVKAVDGHGGSQVFLKNSGNQEEIWNGMGSSDVVVQPLVSGAYRDVRVYVIGEEIIAAVCRSAKSGFKSNYSLGGDVALYSLSRQESALVYQIIQQFDFGLVGIDFLIDGQGQFLFNEIEDVVGARMLYALTDIPLLEKYFAFILEQI